MAISDSKQKVSMLNIFKQMELWIRRKRLKQTKKKKKNDLNKSEKELRVTCSCGNKIIVI